MLLGAHEVPLLLRRAHIHHGYRPTGQPRLYYVKSAFQLHNEVVNVWTHAIPLVLLQFLYVVPELFGHQRWQLLVLYAGIGCLLAASALTHLMHSRSQRDHVFWILVDFSGIAVFALAVGVQRWSCRADQNTEVFTWIYLSSLLLVVLVQYLSTCGLFLLHPHWKWRHAIRIGSYLLLAAWLYTPMIDRYVYAWSQNWPHDPTLHLHSRAFCWLLLSGVFLSAHLPERFWPGRFDIVGYGHQLFHLCIAMVTWTLVDAAHIDCNVEAEHGRKGWWGSNDYGVDNVTRAEL